MMWISLRCSSGWRSGACGGHGTTVNSSSCSRKQADRVWAGSRCQRTVACGHNGTDLVPFQPSIVPCQWARVCRLLVLADHRGLLWCVVHSETLFEIVNSVPFLLGPLTSTRLFLLRNCCSLDLFSFSDHSLSTLQKVVHENPSPPRSKVTYIPFLPHCDARLELQRVSSRRHASIHSAAAVWLAR